MASRDTPKRVETCHRNGRINLFSKGFKNFVRTAKSTGLADVVCTLS
jgi:hypothetical protein